MSQIDVRGLLQYVPQFRGKVFVIYVDVPISALAETMLDLVSLQNIGVRLVIGSNVHRLDLLLDRAAEVELKFSQTSISFGGNKQSEIEAPLERGQAVMIDSFGEHPLSEQQAKLAVAIDAAKLILLNNGEGLPAHGAVSAAEVQTEKNDSILSRAAEVCNKGVPRVHLLDGRLPAVLLSELFSNEGVGTMVYMDSYREVRPVREDDIVELLGMIARSVRSSHLVPRGYADIENHLEDYSVMDIDGNVVGCVALLRYEGSDMAEVACLYVKQAHEGMGYGFELVRYAEKRAEELGVQHIFSLTNRAAQFFQERMGYAEMKAAEIPLKRQGQLMKSGRDSRVFGRSL